MTSDFRSSLAEQQSRTLGDNGASAEPIRSKYLTRTEATIPRRDNVPMAPLSFGQERLWFLDQLVAGSAWYNVHLALRLDWPLEVDVMHRALNEVVRRHEILRTNFRVVDSQPVQVIAPAMDIPIQVIDLRSLSDAECNVETVRLATEEARRPFDLAEGALIRATVLWEKDHEYVFLLTMHHMVSDAWSIGVLVGELNGFYASFLSGNPATIPELPIQYADFAVWQRKWLQAEVLEQQLAYWRRALRGVSPLRLPTDHPRPAVQTDRGSYHLISLPLNLSKALKELSQQEHTTLFMTLLAAFQILLCRYSGQDDIAVGTPVANRPRAELEPLIGFFVNTLVMRGDLSGNPRFREVLARVKQSALDAYSHQDAPFEKLVEDLEHHRDLSRNPLFQVSFQLFNPSEAQRAAAAAGPRQVKIHKGTANLDLSLDLFDGPNGLTGPIEYSLDLFEPETIARMAGHFRILLEGIVTDPDARISELPLLTWRERNQIAVEWNDTASSYPHDRCIHQLFEDQVEQSPDAIAIVHEGGRISYRELNRRANRLARYLCGRSVPIGAPIGICLERSVESIVAVLAILKTGCAYVPLDPLYPVSRLAFLIEDARLHTLLTESKHNARLPASVCDAICVDTEASAISLEREENLGASADSDQLAYVIYTSGSTGQPKGVMVRHRSVCNHLHWFRTAFQLTAQDRTAHKYSLSFDVAALEIFAPLLAGARLILVSSGREADMAYLARLIAEEGITALDLVPSSLEMLLEQPEFGGCVSLKQVFCGGEAMPATLQQKFFRTLDAELYNLYGPTEATIGATWWQCERGDDRPNVPIGRPIANTQIYVLDPNLNVLPPGVAGELYIGGDGVAGGYLNRPELTAMKFIPNPFRSEADALMYRTGDLARMGPDGVCEYLGRVDDQIKLRGFRIEPAEIEARLMQHPGVLEAIVVALEDVPESDELPAAGLEFDRPVEAPATTPFRRHTPDYDLTLKVERGYISPPGEWQRNWLLQRSLDEFTDDLRHLDAVASRFVRGSARPVIDDAWVTSPASVSDGQLVIEGQQVMQDWERPLMHAMADLVTEKHGDVLEIGFGLGISATRIQERGARSHTIVEYNSDVLRLAEQWSKTYPNRDIRLVNGKWQDAVHRLGHFDGIFFDAYPVDEAEFQAAVLESITFAEAFIPVAASLLRKQGVFTYYSNEIDSLSRRHQRLILRWFSAYAVSVIRGLSPPQDCNYWWADSMAVVKAVK